MLKRSALGLVLGLSIPLLSGCGGRWQPQTSHDVPTQAAPDATYAAVLEVAAAQRYTLLSKDPAAKKLRLQAESNGKSFIDVQVVAGQVRLAPGGALVRGDKVHKVLEHELDELEAELKRRVGSAATSAPVAAAPAAESPTTGAATDASSVPQAWSEPAYDPSVWGNGNFTCLPVRIPQEHQGALTLQLTNGEKADLQLSLAYAPELCRSPSQCKLAGGCPALGIGDTERVNRLAGRLSRGEVGSQATLLDSGKSVAKIDLARHGSIVQAMSEMKH